MDIFLSKKKTFYVWHCRRIVSLIVSNLPLYIIIIIHLAIEYYQTVHIGCNIFSKKCVFLGDQMKSIWYIKVWVRTLYSVNIYVWYVLDKIFSKQVWNPNNCSVYKLCGLAFRNAIGQCLKPQH